MSVEERKVECGWCWSSGQEIAWQHWIRRHYEFNTYRRGQQPRHLKETENGKA
jgi:hypothetical protein